MWREVSFFEGWKLCRGAIDKLFKLLGGTRAGQALAKAIR